MFFIMGRIHRSNSNYVIGEYFASSFNFKVVGLLTDEVTSGSSSFLARSVKNLSTLRLLHLQDKP